MNKIKHSKSKKIEGKKQNINKAKEERANHRLTDSQFKRERELLS